jgi:transcriptional regulator with XRE-family HTH domain
MRKRQPTPKQARAQAGLTQLEVAALSGLTPSTIYRIEKANRWPNRVKTRRALRQALGLDAEGEAA